MRSSFLPKPSDVVKVTRPRSRSRSPSGATAVITAPPAGVRYVSAAVRSPARTRSVRSDHTPRGLLEADGVARVEARVRAARRAPLRPLAARRVLGGAGVQAQPGHLDERVRGVRPDRDPLTAAGRAPAHE